MHKAKVKGFSLVELIIIMAILSIVAVVAAKILDTAFDNYFTNVNISQADQEARIAFEKMTREIHAIPYANAITTATAAQLTFTDINGNAMTYKLTGTNLMQNSYVLASGISALSFSYWTSGLVATTTKASIYYVTITMTMTLNNVNYTFRTTVHPLNY